MSKNFVQAGNVLRMVAPAGGVTSGSLVVIGDIAVVATTTAAETEPFEGALGGVYELAKATADTPAQGANAFFDEAAGEVTTVSVGNRLVGIFVEAYGNGDVLAKVRLNGTTLPVAGATE